MLSYALVLSYFSNGGGPLILLGIGLIVLLALFYPVHLGGLLFHYFIYVFISILRTSNT